jgi:hypothetical protein
MATKPIDWAATPAHVAKLPRNAVHAMIDMLIERLDLDDGDPDVEPNGDEADGSMEEDEFMFHRLDGPGCPLADPDYCSAHDDDPTYQSYDGRPGDPEDGEDGGDTELNGDEGDHTPDLHA